MYKKVLSIILALVIIGLSVFPHSSNNKAEAAGNLLFLTGNSYGGTVTSVNATNGTSGISVSGVPITSAGTLAISLSNNLVFWNNLAPGSVSCNNTSIPSIANNGTVTCVPINFLTGSGYTSASMLCTASQNIDFTQNYGAYLCASNNGMNGNYTFNIANNLGPSQDLRTWQLVLYQNGTGNFVPTITYAGHLLIMGTGGTGSVTVSSASNSVTIFTFKYYYSGNTLVEGAVLP